MAGLVAGPVYLSGSGPATGIAADAVPAGACVDEHAPASASALTGKRVRSRITEFLGVMNGASQVRACPRYAARALHVATSGQRVSSRIAGPAGQPLRHAHRDARRPRRP